MRVTPWFPADIKPVHVGVYETQCGVFGDSYRYWDGQRWSVARMNPVLAFDSRSWVARNQSPRWRGLAQPAHVLPNLGETQ